MGPGLIALIVIGVIVLLLILWAVGVYNNLVTLRNRFKNAFAQIDVQLKRRFDLIPNLVETVKGYMAHERQTLEAVIQARNQAVSAQSRAAADPGDAGAIRGLMAADAALTGGLGRLFALAEAYPQLRAVESFTALQQTLGQIEEAIQNARRYYNAVVRDLNTRIHQFPSNLVAGLFGFRPREFFEIPDAERQAPRVSF